MFYLIDQLNALVSQLEDGKANADNVSKTKSLLREITLRSEIPVGSLGKLTAALTRLSGYCKSHGNQSLAYEILRVIDFLNGQKVNVGKTAAQGEAKMRQETQFKQATNKIMSNFGFNIYSYLFK